MSLSLSFVLGGASIAEAQNYPGTRQGEYIAEHDKSKIDDQLVKVGQKNEYLYTYPKLNVSVNPFSPLYDRISLSASYALTMHIAIRADLSLHVGEDDYYSDDFFEDANSYTLSAPIYFRKVYSGFYLEPGSHIGELYGEHLLGFQVLAGWHWMWDSGLNVSTALGMGRNVSPDGDCGGGYDDYETSSFAGDVVYCEQNPDLYPAGYFRVGYAF